MDSRRTSSKAAIKFGNRAESGHDWGTPRTIAVQKPNLLRKLERELAQSPRLSFPGYPTVKNVGKPAKRLGGCFQR